MRYLLLFAATCFAAICYYLLLFHAIRWYLMIVAGMRYLLLFADTCFAAICWRSVICCHLLLLADTCCHLPNVTTNSSCISLECSNICSNVLLIGAICYHLLWFAPNCYYLLQWSSKMAPKLPQNGLKMAPKTTQNGPQITPGAPRGLKILFFKIRVDFGAHFGTQKVPQNDLKIVKTCVKNRALFWSRFLAPQSTKNTQK